MAGLTMKVQVDPNNPNSRGYAELTPGNTYRVIGIEADDYRLVNDEGMPYLYPKEIFRIVDAQEPEDWQTVYGDEGERYSYPKELSEPGFFEDVFDGNGKAVAILRYYLANKWRQES
jgi:hypothetical protein